MGSTKTRLLTALLMGCWTAIIAAFAISIPVWEHPPSSDELSLVFLAVFWLVGLAAVRGLLGRVFKPEPRRDLERDLGVVDEKGKRNERRLEMALEHARDMAQKAEEASGAKSIFLAKMSHEIRTPLNAILGISAILRETHLTDEQKELVEVIHSSGDALLSIVNDILDFSKIEAGKIELSKVEFCLAALLEDVERMLSVRAREKGIDFTAEADEDLPLSFRGDERRLSQILTNLGANAVKFTEKGRVALEAKLVEKKEHSATIRLSVSDTGIGVEERELPRIFDAFYQVDGSFTRQHGGTGLGLAITKQLVEAMGGALEVESVPGKGTTFSFTLELEAGQSRLPVAAGRNRPQNLKILIVSDEDHMKRLISSSVACRAEKTVQVEAGRDGWVKYLQFVSREPFDAVVVSLTGKESDIRGLARRIRTQKDLHQPGIIGLVSQGERDIDALFDEGYDAVLKMPSASSLICEALNAALDKRTSSEPAGSEESNLVTEETLRTERFSGMQLLVAEDNAVNQKVIRKILERCGAFVTVVSNGHEAIEALKTKLFDLVIMDVQMPKLDGLMATRSIRAGQAGSPAKSVPIVALTAHAVKGDQERIMAAGMDAYLAKPVEPTALMEVVEGLVGKGGGRISR